MPKLYFDRGSGFTLMSKDLADSSYLMHYRVGGEKKGVRRWQNKDGSYTSEGYQHYADMYGWGKKDRSGKMASEGYARYADLCGLKDVGQAKKQVDALLKRRKEIDDMSDKLIKAYDSIDYADNGSSAERWSKLHDQLDQMYIDDENARNKIGLTGVEATFSREGDRLIADKELMSDIENILDKEEYQDSPKSKSSVRVMPLTPKAVAILKRLKNKRKTEWVFEQDGERYTYQKLMYQTKKLCREAGVKYYGEHVFRHTFATNCYYKGIDVKILSKLMGHSSVQVTYNIYVNLYGDGFDDMYAALCF